MTSSGGSVMGDDVDEPATIVGDSHEAVGQPGENGGHGTEADRVPTAKVPAVTARPSNDLADWFPIIANSGVPVPATRIVYAPNGMLLSLLDGETPHGFDRFLEDLRQAARHVGYPLFLRTGQGSGKHDYLDTCLVLDEASLGQHVFNLVEWSTCVDFFGLSVDTWAVRELLPVEAPFTVYNGMPLAKERRYFVSDGRVIGHHPYWPPGAVEQGIPTLDGRVLPEDEWRPLYDALSVESQEETTFLAALTEQATKRLPGSWSIDWLWVPGRGWVCIDLAHFELSFVWEGHPTAPTPPAKRDHLAELVAAIKTEPDSLIQKRQIPTDGAA